MASTGDRGDRTGFVHRTLIVLSLIALLFLAWQLRALFLMLFGSVIVATVFRAIARPFHQHLRLSDSLSVGLAVLIVAGLFALTGWLFGAELAAQARQLADTLPSAWQFVQARLEALGLTEEVQQMLQSGAEGGSRVVSVVGGYAMTFFGGLTDTVLVIVGGIYLAAQPRFYHRGLLKLFPKHRRALVDEAAVASGKALRLWLKGALIAMTVTGLLTGIGLWLLGVRSALALGLIAGLLDFIPLIGPLVAAVPGILIALTYGPETALWVAGLYLLVQQIEGNILQPIVQQRTVDLPPVILLFALLGAGTLFGLLGVVLAAPLAVVLYVLVKRLYVEEALDTETPVPGRDEDN